jgi:hypothetical protein
MALPVGQRRQAGRSAPNPLTVFIGQLMAGGASPTAAWLRQSLTRGVWGGPVVVFVPGQASRYHCSLTFHRPAVVLVYLP